MTRQAEVDEENARRTREAGKRSAKDKDLEAAIILSRRQASRAASGFEVGSASFLRSAARDRFLATRDRMRIVEGAERRSDSFYERAAGARSEASGAKTAGIFGLIGTGLNLYGDLISDAALTNNTNARKIQRKSREIY
jgi:hypothetical protein